MNTTRKYPAALIFAVLVVCGARLHGAELLGNPTFEALAPSLVGWNLDETVTGSPGTVINSAEIAAFANQPMEIAGQSGLWLRAFAGNTDPFAMMNKKSNAILSQSVPGVVGETYNFKGWSKWEQNYAGGVTTLDEFSPSGAVPSPTQDILEVAFLNSGGVVIGSPVTFDLRSSLAMGGQIADNTWRQHTVPAAVAPAGTASVRVRALATDMVFNVDPQQSGFYDTFSLTAASAPSTELLTNGNLNFVTGAPVWTKSGNLVFNTDGFANHTPGGTVGSWLQTFLGGDGTVTQTVPGTPGTNYTFSGWSKWETNYSGGQTGTGTSTLMEMEFLNGSGGVIGSPVMLDLRTQQSNGAGWKEHTLMGTAPAGTANIRVSGLATGMVSTTGQQGAFFDDFSLMAAVALAGDFNNNGTVDAADYVVWRDNVGTTNTLPNDNGIGGTVGTAHYNLWRTNFGNSAGSGAGVNLLESASVPEPAGCILAAIALCAVAVGRRGRNGG